MSDFRGRVGYREQNRQIRCARYAGGLKSKRDCRRFPFVLRDAARNPFDIRCPGALLRPFSVIVAQQFAGFSRRVPPGHERETRPRSDAFRDAIERRLPELFREAGRVRRMREVPDSPPIGVATTGCLRAVLLLLLLFILTSLAMPLLLGAFIQLMSQ